MADAKDKRAKAQRKYAAKRKKEGIPAHDDVARAILKGFQDVFAANPTQAETREKWAPLSRAALRHLVGRGFDRKQAEDRLIRILRARDDSR
jgi:hypothetical protein